MLIRMLYISSATSPMSDEDMLNMLEKCRVNNAARNITGMLLYCQDTFVQVLEGEDKDVDALYNCIKKDSRHSGINILERKVVDKRQFPDWSMGFKKITDADLSNVEGLNSFFEHDAGSDYFIHEQNIVSLLMQHFRKKYQAQMAHAELPTEDVNPLIGSLHKTIIKAVNVLAVLMVAVIIFGVWDVVVVIFDKLFTPPYLMLTVSDILATFGSFMMVLIAIEIFINITLYLRTDVIPIRLVLATAVMAVARKIIIFDYKAIDPQYVYASGVVLLALGVTYWIVGKYHAEEDKTI